MSGIDKLDKLIDLLNIEALSTRLKAAEELIVAQQVAVAHLGDHYCGTHEEDQPYHAVGLDAETTTCVGCRATVLDYRIALAKHTAYRKEYPADE